MGNDPSIIDALTQRLQFLEQIQERAYRGEPCMCALRGRQPGHSDVRAASVLYQGRFRLPARQVLQSVSRFRVSAGETVLPLAVLRPPGETGAFDFSHGKGNVLYARFVQPS